jgi:hypothetical protein
MTPNLKKLTEKMIMLSDGSFGLRGTIQTEVRVPISSPGEDDTGEGEPTYSKSTFQ